ncbi:MAG: malonyl-CoA synthase [Hyphomicrobiaceae bacterium]
MPSRALDAVAREGVHNLAALIEARCSAADTGFIEEPGGRSWSYAEAWSLAGRLANALTGAGVGIGDRVAIQVEKSPEAVLLFWATARIGAIYLPLNTAYTPREVSYFLTDAEPTVVIARPEAEAEMTALARSLGVTAVLTLGTAGDGTLMEKAASAAGDPPAPELGWDDLAAILYTSGTTGRSKGAMLTHGNLASNALTLSDTWAFTGDDVLIHALPVYHTHGLFTASNTLTVAGGKMLWLPKFDAGQVLGLMPQATTLMGVPTFYTRLLDHPGLTAEAAAHMRLFISGSAPLLAETHRAFEVRTGHAILERYGMTETNMNTSNPYRGRRRAGTVGFPLEDVTLRITDPASGAPLPQGEIGMIELKGPNVCAGYWRNPEKTAESFRPDGSFITGDLGIIDGEGYVSIVGRGKDLVISGGLNVYPKEVEDEIDALSGVVESAVIGLPHADLGEAVTAVVVCTKDATLDEAAVLRALAPKLAKFKLPKRVLFLAELPRNAMGKVQKAKLRETYDALYNC